MGKLLNLLAYLFVALFIAGVAFLAYGSYNHMQQQSANLSGTTVKEKGNEMAENLKDEVSGWDEDEDLLEDDEVDELLAEDGILEEIEASSVDLEGDGDEDGKGANTSKVNDPESDAVLAEAKKSTTSEVAGKAPAATTPAKSDIPTEFGKAINLNPKKDLFLVISGSFTVAENAEKDALAMRKKGYPNTETVQFASTKYLSVCTGRFENMADARKMVEKIKRELKIDAYVHKRRWK